MDDYLTLIRNPQRKSPRAQASPSFPTQRRDSGSFYSPKAEPSIDLSSLNRPVAPISRDTNMRSSYLVNPQPLDRSTTSRENPLRTSTSNLNNSGFFIQDTTSQVVQRKPSMGQSLMRNQPVPLRQMSYNEKSPTNQGRDSGPTSPMGASATFWQGAESMSRKRSFTAPAQKKPKRRRRINYKGILLILAIIGASAWLLRKYVFPPEVIYCDNVGIRESRPGCEPCPNHGTCKEGHLISCDEPYKMHRNYCVDDYEAKSRFKKYRMFINDRMAYFKGEKLCDPTTPVSINMNQIHEFLLAVAPDDKYLSDFKTFKARWDLYFQEETDGLVKDEITETYSTTSAPQPSLVCKMKLLWTEGKLIFLWVLLFICLVIILIKLAIRHAKYSNIAIELYNDVLAYLRHWNTMTLKSLKREFENRYPEMDFEKLWSYVEDEMKKGGRIRNYTDYQKGEVQEFWTLAR